MADIHNVTRTWVFDVLINSPEIAAHVENRILQASSLGIDPAVDPPRRPFLVYRAGGSTPMLNRVTRMVPYTFYVHDEQGSYLNHIEPCLDAIEQAFENRGSQLWNGKQMFAAEWAGNSDDLYDDMFRTAVKYATINVVARS